MFESRYAGFDQRPQAFLLRRLGSLFLITGLGLNVWMLTSGENLQLRLALLVLAPGAILLFTAFLAETTPSMRGCLSVFGLLMAFMAGFWAWVGVTVVLDPDDSPPEILREAVGPSPGEVADEDEEQDEEAPDAEETTEDAADDDLSGEDTDTQSEE